MTPGLEYLRCCSEYQVPYEVDKAWMDEMLTLKTQKERDAFFREKIEKIKATYTIITKDEFLQRVEMEKSWEKLTRYYRNYWQEVQDILKDAVRLDCVEVAALLAPHCLFEDEELLRECMLLVPGDKMRETLMAPVNHARDEKHADKVFCLKRSSVRRGSAYVHRVGRLLTFDGEIQKSLWKAFVQLYGKGDEETLKRKIDRAKNNNEQMRWQSYLDALGYMNTKAGFRRRNLPAYWMNQKLNAKAWPDESERLTAMASKMHDLMYEMGWKTGMDWVVNEFGGTGYLFLKEIPEQKEG